MTLSVREEAFPLARAFTISRGSRTEARVLTVTIAREGATGRGECLPYPRYGESLHSVRAQIEALPEDVGRAELQNLLPPGAARSAVDCALWDLEAKRRGRRVWQLAGLTEPKPVVSAYTLSLDTPEAMEREAAAQAARPILKLKLGGEGDMARLEAVRRGAPASRLVVDANEGWSVELYAALAPVLVRLGVEMVEQPLPAGEDAALAGVQRVLPVCADESCHDRAGLADLRGRYDMVNVKLDKTGGLTEALALLPEALAMGFGIMVGCMMTSSLAVAPAVLIAQDAALADLDPPMLLARDREPSLAVDGAGVHPPEPALWG
jgi:L-alanine-DL-glutamate epimerase-like enolase superfamily enzyme